MAPKPPSVTRALAIATRATKPTPGDTAAIALAKHYAHHLDTAAHLSGVAAELLDEAMQAGDEDLAKRVALLARQVDAQTVAGEIGPKLLAVLAALKMTPAARAAVVSGGEAPGARGPGADALEQLRARRRR